MTLDLDELERLAKAATPGPWEPAFRDTVIAGPTKKNTPREVSGGRGVVARVDDDDESLWAQAEANAEHIAAANPEVVLALVARVRLAEEWSRKGLYSYHGGRCSMAGGPWPENPRECESPVCRQWAEDLLP